MHAGVSDRAPRLRRGRLAGPPLAVTRQVVLPSRLVTLSAPGIRALRGSMASLHAPLPTLRPAPRGTRRTARGRRDSLDLHRRGLSPPAPCRSPDALPAALMIDPPAIPTPSCRPRPSQGQAPAGIHDFLCRSEGSRGYRPEPVPAEAGGRHDAGRRHRRVDHFGRW